MRQPIFCVIEEIGLFVEEIGLFVDFNLTAIRLLFIFAPSSWMEIGVLGNSPRQWPLERLGEFIFSAVAWAASAAQR